MVYWSVNMENLSKSMLLRREDELRDRFAEVVAVDPEQCQSDAEPLLRWRARPDQIVLIVDGYEVPYEVVYRLAPSVAEVRELEHAVDGRNRLLVTVELSELILEVCRPTRLSSVDLNGRHFLRADRVWIERPQLPGRQFKVDASPRNIFEGKSAAIVRALLADCDAVQQQPDLILRSGASPALVSRVLKFLRVQGYVSKSGKSVIRVTDPQALVDAWCRADKFADRAASVQYSTFGAEPTALATELTDWAKTAGVDFALTRWIAGWLRVPYTEPVVVSAYVSRLPTPQEASALGLSPVNEGGTVVLHVPTDPGVFKETRTVGVLPVVSDAQIVVDLQNTGLRGPDQAKALRESQKFCRP